jgi:hypothetical protein
MAANVCGGIMSGDDWRIAMSETELDRFVGYIYSKTPYAGNNMNTPMKQPVMKEFWVCPLCKAENFMDLNAVAANGIPHLDTRVAHTNVCSKCVRTVPGDTIKVVGKKWGHDKA